MHGDRLNHVRVALLGFVTLLLFCATLAHQWPVRRSVSADNRLESGTASAETARKHAETDATLRQLTALARGQPTPAEFRWVRDCLQNPSWRITGQAFGTLTAHRHPQLHAAAVDVLQRALDFTARPGADADRYPDRQECRRVMQQAVVQLSTQPVAADQTLNDLLPGLCSRAPDGPVRAQALKLLDSHRPAGWQQLVLSALEDPSEQVRLVALGIVARERWGAATPQLELLASSPRPALRQRSLEVLDLLGRSCQPRDYGESVLEAAERLAESLNRAGMRPEDVLAIPLGHDDKYVATLLARQAEDHLDRFATLATAAADFHGVLLLAATVSTGQRKYTLRLWEQEIPRIDSDAELLDRGLEALAQTRFLAGLAAYRQGQHTAGLKELASVAELAHYAGDWSSMQVYVKRAGDLSAEIWQGTVQQLAGRKPTKSRSDPVAPVAARILQELDLNRPEHRAEARRRLDAWCGLAPAENSGAMYGPMAN